MGFDTQPSNAAHVLQAQVQLNEQENGPAAWPASRQKSLAFQEYSPSNPHIKHSLGFAGRPGGASAFYVNVLNNTRNHGGDRKGEADGGPFGLLLGGPADAAVVRRMQSQPGADRKMGFVKGQHAIQIVDMRLLVGAAAQRVIDEAEAEAEAS